MTNPPWTRSRNDRIVGGVAAGLAQRLSLPAGIVRAALALAVLGGLLAPPLAAAVAVLYAAAAFLLPASPPGVPARAAATVLPGLVRPREGRLIAGVALGLARPVRLDPAVVRVGFLALSLAGAGLIGYVVLWLLMPDETAA